MNRVWIYQADRVLTDEEVKLVELALSDFVASWTAHGSALAGSGVVKENLFVILEVDEAQAGVTGCSIDKSVHFLKGLGDQVGIDFFDRMKISYKDTEGKVNLVSRNEFESLIKAGKVNQDTIVFNNLVQDASQLATQWELAFKDSWHSKVF